MKLLNFKELVFGIIIVAAMLLSVGVFTSRADHSVDQDGRTMVYNLSINRTNILSPKWDAYTYCVEDARAFVGLTTYSKSNCGGTAVWSDSKTANTRSVFPGSSVSAYYAHLSHGTSKSKSARSGHALKYLDSNRPCISTLYLDKNK